MREQQRDHADHRDTKRPPDVDIRHPAGVLDRQMDDEKEEEQLGSPVDQRDRGQRVAEQKEDPACEEWEYGAEVFHASMRRPAAAVSPVTE